MQSPVGVRTPSNQYPSEESRLNAIKASVGQEKKRNLMTIADGRHAITTTAPH